MLKNVLFYILLVTTALFTGCGGELSFPSFFDKGTLLAKVEDNSLYLEDIKNIFHPSITKEDSLVLLNSYVDRWVKTMLKVEQAREEFKEDTKDIDNLIKQYTNTLLINKYESFSSSNIDTLVTEQQITEYYEENKDKFLLPSPIVTGLILIYPESYRGEKKLLELMKSKKEDEQDDFLDIVKKNDFKLLEYNNWTYFSEVLENIPFSNKSIDEFLKNNSIYKIADDDNQYVMLIKTYRNSGGISPMDMVRSNIEKIIINSRRTHRLKEVEDTLYNRAIRNERLFINEPILNGETIENTKYKR